MTPLLISRYTATSALGAGLAAHARALRETHSGLRQQASEDSALACWTGTVDGLDVALSKRWAEWDCRIHRLAALALEQDGFRGAVADAVARHGADRVAVFIGTRSEEHTSELQSLMRNSYAVFCLKKNRQ